MTNTTVLEQIKMKIEAMKAEKAKNITINNIDLVSVKNNIHVPVSASQIATYMKLCVEKHVQPDPLYRSFDGKRGHAMDKAIQTLIKLPTIKAPSEKQIEMLKDICTRNDWAIPSYTHLTGGRDGSFSALIAELFEMEKEVQKIAPPTENQVATILEMYNCPDVDFSDLNEQYGLVYITNPVKGGKLLWTRPSLETIMETVSTLITYQEASAFIYKFQLEFYKWKTTRLSTGQMNRIKKAQTQCGMMPMSDASLLQFDKQTADKYLMNLNLVRRDVDLVKFPKEAFQEDISRCNTVVKAIEQDQVNKEGLLHSLYAMMGMNGNEESETSIDLSLNDDIIADLALVVIDVCGSDSVMELLGSVYTVEEMTIMIARMYPCENDMLDKMYDGMSQEELESLVSTMTA